MELRQQAILGVKWAALAQGGKLAAQLITTGVLAHLLAPNAFGVVSMATVVTGFVLLLKDMGTYAAIIQKTELSTDLVSSVYWFNVALGCLITGALYLAAPIVASFYHEPTVAPVLRLLSFSFVLSSVSSIQQALLEKKMAFNQLAKIDLAATIGGSAVGIVAAFRGYGAMSLVYQTLFSTVATTILLWVVSDWKPQFFFSPSRINQLRSYSLPLSGFNILNYFIRNADNLLVGKYLGAAPLGDYSLAYRLLLFPISNVSGVVGRVMFPVYSRLQDDDTAFRRYYLKVAETISFVTFPMMLGFAVVAKPFVSVFAGAQWHDVVPLLWVLAPLGMMQSVGTTVGSIYNAKGRTDTQFKWGLFSSIIILFSFIIGLKWGVIGVATAYALTSTAILYPSFAIPFRFIGLGVKSFLGALWKNFLGAALMAVFVLCIELVLGGRPAYEVLLLSVCGGTLFYIGYSALLNRELLISTLQMAGVQRRSLGAPS